MTYSILALDPETGRFGGAAATGSLCVGGWVLRGDSRIGMSASQGTCPSTLWGEEVLERIGAGLSAEQAVREVTEPDAGRAYRQLSALDRAGGTGAFTGGESIPACGALWRGATVVAGNMLTSEAVLDAVLSGFEQAAGALSERLLAALEAGRAAGSDSRGLQSAALLVLGDDIAPISLRVDWDEHPLERLRELYRRSQTAPYADWLDRVPTRNAPHRAID